jgi:hypothetical protein
MLTIRLTSSLLQDTEAAAQFITATLCPEAALLFVQIHIVTVTAPLFQQG